MSKTERPRAVPRTGADLARAARAAKTAIGARLASPQRPTAEPASTASEPKDTGGYAGVIGGAPPTVERRDLPFEERPGVTTTWFPFPGSTPQPVLPPIPDSKE